MKKYILDNIEFKVDEQDLIKKFHIQPESADAERLGELIKKAQIVAKPKAVYQVGEVTHAEENSVRINGILLTSRVLRINLEEVDRAFVYVATCGHEIAEWAETITDARESEWLDGLMDQALDAAIDFVYDHIEDQYDPGRVGYMNPGPVEDWPISEQQPVFEIIGETDDTVGVTLQENMLMTPLKTVSEIVFPSEEGFTTCKLCSQEACASREAPYDETLYKSKFS